MFTQLLQDLVDDRNDLDAEPAIPVLVFINDRLFGAGRGDFLSTCLTVMASNPLEGPATLMCAFCCGPDSLPVTR